MLWRWLLLCLRLLKLLAILLLAILREALSVSAVLAVLCIAASPILRETAVLAIAVLPELLTGHERGRARLEASCARSEGAEAGRALLLRWWLLHVHLLRLLGELVGLGLPVICTAVGVGHGGEAVSVRESGRSG